MGTTSKTRRSRQHKTIWKVIVLWNALCFKLKPKKNSQKQRITYSDSKQNSKELSDLLPSANMKNQISTFKNWRTGSTHTLKRISKNISLYTQKGKTQTQIEKNSPIWLFSNTEKTCPRILKAETSSAASTCPAKHARHAEAVKSPKTKKPKPWTRARK